MSQYLKWHESPHWNKNQTESEQAVAVMERPRKTEREITDSIMDDPRYNTINPSNQRHIIDMAIAAAKNNGTLVEGDNI